ncbi:MAG: hypothetical protein LBS17_06605, partial [Actinomycetes bacterium]|nr:hypothetical protein [Actinomycetes bacterium]
MGRTPQGLCAPTHRCRQSHRFAFVLLCAITALLLSASAAFAATITKTVISGIKAPAAGETPVSTIVATDEYTGTVTWAPVHTTFQRNTVYIATVTLTPTSGFDLTGVTANAFTVAGAASVTNAPGSGTITVVYPQSKYYFLIGNNNFDNTGNPAASTGLLESTVASDGATPLDTVIRSVGSIEKAAETEKLPLASTTGVTATDHAKGYLSMYVGDTFEKDYPLQWADPSSTDPTFNRADYNAEFFNFQAHDHYWGMNAGYGHTPEYAAQNKLVDYQMNAENNVVLPARYNTLYDGVTISGRIPNPYEDETSRLPNIYLNAGIENADVLPGEFATRPNVTGSNPLNGKNFPLVEKASAGAAASLDGTVLYGTQNLAGSTPGSTKYAEPIQVKLAIKNLSWQAYCNAINGEPGYGFPGGIPGMVMSLLFQPNPLKDYSMNVNDIQTVVNNMLSGAETAKDQGVSNMNFGYMMAMSGVYRNDFVDWSADTATRIAESTRPVTVHAGITNKNKTNGFGDYFSNGDAEFTIEITRPTITATDYNATAQKYLTSYTAPGTWDSSALAEFQQKFGFSSIAINDDGLTNVADSGGKAQYVGTANAVDRTAVLFRVGNSASWQGPYLLNSTTDLQSVYQLIKTSQATSPTADIQLLYTYAAADADPAIIGELPADIADKQGAYATPLLRHVTTNVGSLTLNVADTIVLQHTFPTGAVVSNAAIEELITTPTNSYESYSSWIKLIALDSSDTAIP